MQQPPEPAIPNERREPPELREPPEPREAVDPLDALRAELDSLAEQPVVDRVERFDHANAVLAAALAELDEI